MYYQVCGEYITGMARKFKDFVERDKPRKRPRRHCKNPNKKKKLQNNKKYNRQGRRQK